MKKLLLMLILVLTTTFSLKAGNVFNPVLMIPFAEDTITSISVNVPSRIKFYSVEEHHSTDIVVKLNSNAARLNLEKWIIYEIKDGVLHINLKNYTTEEMNNFDQDMFRFYIPEAYFDKIQTRKGFTIKKSGITKNDSGNSTI